MKYSIFLGILFLSTTLQAQGSGDYPPNAQPGKCYAKCLSPQSRPSLDTSYHAFLKYTGAEPDSFDVEIIKLFHPAYTAKVEIQGANGRTRTVERSHYGWTERFYALNAADTVQTSDYEQYEAMVVHRDYKLMEQVVGGLYWYEVLCGDETTKATILSIKAALRRNGFSLKKTDILDAETKEALTEFQRTHGLPIGSLDFDTLDMLGVDY